MAAIVVLGMHRSGTSCLAGMLSAAGLASAGEAVRNWDNARGHHEMLDVVRLNESVLAHSGGHWLSPPASVRFTDEHARERDRILRARVDGLPALLKDPRTLLTLPFWRASTAPLHVIGIVRHPLAVARSLESWRATPLEQGVALWTAHNRALEADRRAHRYPLIDFERTRAEVIAAVTAFAHSLAEEAEEAEEVDEVDEAALAAAYEEQLVHHDGGDAPEVSGLAEAVALHRVLTGGGSTLAAAPRAPFPRTELAELSRLLERGELDPALASARAALASVADAAAVLVPVVTALSRKRAFAAARQLVDEQAGRLDEGLADLLHGKLLLAMGEPSRAILHLEAACAVARPYFQARHLLPQALRGAGRHAEARAALSAIALEALYPHGPLSTSAEWCWLDGERAAALAEMARAIEAAPPHRRGRLRARRAEWLIAEGEREAARGELLAALDEDPSYARSRALLMALA